MTETRNDEAFARWTEIRQADWRDADLALDADFMYLQVTGRMSATEAKDLGAIRDKPLTMHAKVQTVREKAFREDGHFLPPTRVFMLNV